MTYFWKFSADITSSVTTCDATCYITCDSQDNDASKTFGVKTRPAPSQAVRFSQAPNRQETEIRLEVREGYMDFRRQTFASGVAFQWTGDTTSSGGCDNDGVYGNDADVYNGDDVYGYIDFRRLTFNDGVYGDDEEVLVEL